MPRVPKNKTQLHSIEVGQIMFLNCNDSRVPTGTKRSDLFSLKAIITNPPALKVQIVWNPVTDHETRPDPFVIETTVKDRKDIISATPFD